MAAVSGMNHFTILSADLARTREFYGSLLGLREGYRPALGIPGLWLYAGDTPVLHVIGGREVPGAGVIDHMAFTAAGLPATVAELDRRGIAYVLRRQVESEVWQLFFPDPDGARVELDFAPDEPAPPVR